MKVGRVQFDSHSLSEWAGLRHFPFTEGSGRPLGPEGGINTRSQAPRTGGGYKYEVKGIVKGDTP